MASNQALALRSMVTHDLETIQNELMAARDKAHILTPFCRSAVPYLPQGWNVFIHQYTISRKQNDKGEYIDQELYPIKGTRKVGLTKIGLWRLEQLAGVSWEDPKTGASTIHRVDDGKDSHVCRYQATGYIRDIDGQIRSQSDGFGYDLREDSPQALGMAGHPEQLAKLRQNIEQQTITKAKLRVLRALLGVQTSYYPEEMDKPFVVLRMAFNIDSIDPANKNKLLTIMAAKQMGIENELFKVMRLEADTASAIEAAQNPQFPEPMPPVALPPPNTTPLEELDPDEIAEREYWKQRDAQIERITKYYLSKKGKTREELSPGRPGLSELNDGELKAIEDSFSKLPDLQ
jgi:hypothetical protein